ncbi:hypothetical protein GGQ99_003373 [Aminobacter niigataensis]|uniref:Uncharacterized protein n=1 Tax=Aminobacter niigataensis TaxID=83265 RepID=A0ABR6L4Q5_9HYPH|nr:hypothetical protein [Aminobacter niigataensis]MBB4651606.1 hypothetical protein [Aminobacter niigataensis]CAI2932185.1 protein of unknown function [Aminobacter niigataensis]
MARQTPDKKKAGNARFPLAPETCHAAGTSVVGMPSIRANAAARGKTRSSYPDARFAPGKLADEAYVGCRVRDCKAVVPPFFGPALLLSY